MTPDPSPKSRVGFGLALGLALGVAIGVASDNAGAGLAIGTALGLALGAASDRGRRSPVGRPPRPRDPPAPEP